MPEFTRERSSVPSADREYLAAVTAESLAGWEAFCRENRISRASLVEVIGLELAALERTPPLLKNWVSAAAALDKARKSRRPAK